MRKQSADEVAEAARRRLALLGRELAGAGLEPSPADRPWTEQVEVDEPVEGRPSPLRPAPVGEPGRHSRRRAAPLSGRGVAWLQDRLPATLQGRVSLGTGHVAVLAVVAAVALAVTAYVTMRARPTVSPVPRPHTSAGTSLAGPAGAAGRASVAPTGTTPAGAAAASATPAAGGSVVVDVAGKVRRPGVATLPAGSRVVDAIRQAGGARPGVDLSSLNLARVLVDGEQILVGEAPAPGVAASASSQPGTASADGALVDINTATLEQLDGLPGVGPVTAQKILDWRSAHGAFTAIDELLEVDGIGEKTLADMAPRLTL
ncbi:MAG TPA: helix-hairpin-helix domain-containing protein [Marmoricola sp.]|nr:helix-hairpin-helix domain-containing protein [Marmoricola sp.]